MKSNLRLVARTAMVAAALSSFLAPAVQAGPAYTLSPAARAFLEPASLLLARVAPGGSRVGVIYLVDDRDHALRIIEPGRPPINVRIEDTTIRNFWWKSDTLVLMLMEKSAGGANLAVAGTRMFASYDLQSGELTNMDSVGAGMLFISELPDSPDEMLFATAGGGAGQNNLQRFNVRTGRPQIAERDPGSTDKWHVNGAGVAVAGFEFESARLNSEEWITRWRAQPGAAWQAIRQRQEAGPLLLTHQGVAPDGRRLVSLDFRSHPNGQVIYFDPATGQGEVVAPETSQQPSGIEIWGHLNQPGSVVYRTNPVTRVHLVPEAGAFHAKMATLMPGAYVTPFNFSRDNTRAIVLVLTDGNSGDYALVDTRQDRVSRIGARYAKAPSDRISPRRDFSFTSSDGLTVTGVITTPAGAINPPLAVFLGPTVNDPAYATEYNPTQQYLASQGYAVAEINHRGTTGFGQPFKEAGNYQAAGAMARDVAEGIRWITGQGWADPQRVAILGFANHGYTAFAAATQHDVAKALVLDNTLLDVSDVPLVSIGFVDRNLRTMTTELGGAAGVLNYRKQLSPLENAPKLKVHFMYHTSVGSGDADGGKLVSAARRNGLSAEVVLQRDVSGPTGLPVKELYTSWMVSARRMELTVEFLKKNGI